MLKFPYGISDFYQVMTEDYVYVDRTDRIPLLEETGKTLLFLRPRRFGKSLLLSMLENYYDVNKADEFDRLFGGLAINRQPTPLLLLPEASEREEAQVAAKALYQ
jgi:hypothetical protein